MENYLISSFSEMYGFTNQSFINLQMISELIILKNAIINSKTLSAYAHQSIPNKLMICFLKKIKCLICLQVSL